MSRWGTPHVGSSTFSLLRSRCREYSLPEEIEACPAIHLPLQELQSGHLPFCLSIRPTQRASGTHRRLILSDLDRELPDLPARARLGVDLERDPKDVLAFLGIPPTENA